MYVNSTLKKYSVWEDFGPADVFKFGTLDVLCLKLKDNGTGSSRMRHGVYYLQSFFIFELWITGQLTLS